MLNARARGGRSATFGRELCSAESLAGLPNNRQTYPEKESTQMNPAPRGHQWMGHSSTSHGKAHWGRKESRNSEKRRRWRKSNSMAHLLSPLQARGKCLEVDHNDPNVIYFYNHVTGKQQNLQEMSQGNREGKDKSCLKTMEGAYKAISFCFPSNAACSAHQVQKVKAHP